MTSKKKTTQVLMSLIHQQNFDEQGMCVACVINLQAPIPAQPP